MEVKIDGRRVLNVYDQIFSKTVTSDAGWTSLGFYDVGFGYLPRLMFVGADVDPGAQGSVTFQLLLNGTPILDPLLQQFTSSPGEIYNPSQSIAVPQRIPEGCRLEMQAKIVDLFEDDGTTPASYGVYARIRVEYVEE